MICQAGCKNRSLQRGVEQKLAKKTKNGWQVQVPAATAPFARPLNPSQSQSVFFASFASFCSVLWFLRLKQNGQIISLAVPISTKHSCRLPTEIRTAPFFATSHSA